MSGMAGALPTRCMSSGFVRSAARALRGQGGRKREREESKAVSGEAERGPLIRCQLPDDTCVDEVEVGRRQSVSQEPTAAAQLVALQLDDVSIESGDEPWEWRCDRATVGHPRRWRLSGRRADSDSPPASRERSLRLPQATASGSTPPGIREDEASSVASISRHRCSAARPSNDFEVVLQQEPKRRTDARRKSRRTEATPDEAHRQSHT
jgi:hypothetical protein